jgi:hypothetical protein
MHAEAQAKQRMVHQDFVHRLNEFLGGLSDENLDLLDDLFAASLGDQHYAGYIRGQIGVIREYNHKRCRCGVNHEEEAKDAFTPDSPVDGSSTPESPSKEADPSALMEGYCVEVVPSDIASHYPTKYRCSNCFTPIVSLDDRMRRSPGVKGCGGCQQMTKHGGKWFER